MRAICMLCGEVYAEISIEGVSIPVYQGKGISTDHAIMPLRYPLTGAMFGSADPFHNVPAPFDHSLEWEHFRCPFGRTHRPMVRPDLVLTHKGMVRLPLDGSPAFLDPTASVEVDRESIGDRVIMVSDEEAEKAVRGAMQCPREDTHEHTDVNDIVDPRGFSIEPHEDIPAILGVTFACPTCGKEFDTEKQMKGHMGGAHRPGKKGKKK